FSNGYRAAQVFYRELTKEHFLQGIKGQQAHRPGSPKPLSDGFQRPVADGAQHFFRPFAACNPGPQIASQVVSFATRRQRQGQLQVAAFTLHFQQGGLAREHSDSVDDFLPLLQRLAVKANQAISQTHTGGLSRTFWIQLGDYRNDSRPPGTDTQRADGIRVFRPPEPVVQLQLYGLLLTAIQVAHAHFQRAAFTQATDQLQIDLGPAGSGLAVDFDDFLAGHQPGLFGQAAHLNRPNHWANLLAAQQRQHPKKHQRQQKVGHRPRRHYGEALLDGLAIERLIEHRGRYITFTLVEHLHIATERNGRDNELCAVAIMPAHQGAAEAHREAQHLDAATPRHPEMPVFVEGHQNTQSDQGADKHVQRAHKFLCL